MTFIFHSIIAVLSCPFSRAEPPVLLEHTAGVTALKPYSNIFALLIAIDDYATKRLEGCLADARDFSLFLRDTLHVPENRIVTLYNHEASREGIIDAFIGKQGLIHNSNIMTGDPIIIFYAGHGSRICAPASWGAEANQFEALCPSDVDKGRICMVSEETQLY